MLGSLLLLVCLQSPTRADLRPTAPSGVQSSFSAAAKYSAERGGVSFLVMQEGRVVAEDYPNGGNANRARELASGTKSFSGVMAACAVQDGLMAWDDRVSDVITEWKSDPRRSQITVRQLLSLSSGIPGGQLATRGARCPPILRQFLPRRMPIRGRGSNTVRLRISALASTCAAS